MTNRIAFIKISLKRHEHNVERKNFKKKERRLAAQAAFNRKHFDVEAAKKKLKELEKYFGGEINYRTVLNKWLPTNIRYLLNNAKSDFFVPVFPKLEKLGERKSQLRQEILYIPKEFSLIDHPEESFSFLRHTAYELLFGKNKTVSFSYKKCEKLDIGAQVFLDIIIKEAIQVIRKCKNNRILLAKFKFINKEIGLTDKHLIREDIGKILYSVGSLALHANEKIPFKDIIPYPLCSHSREEAFNQAEAIAQKEIDITELADYVIDSLARVNRRLTGDKLDNLCKIMGEVLINAEEHSTTKNRFSIGYFQESTKDGKHSGHFRLVILNFGKTIYEKFADPNCRNQDAVNKMKQLSKKYTEEGFFTTKQFEEESLWTLYALQEGITSVPDKKRGNGSIQFIDSFFNLKGNDKTENEKSRMSILSGNTKIIFDGTYQIVKKISNGEVFQYMTFNESGNIEDKPNKDSVQFVKNYFPGTIISAKIYFDEEDLLDGSKRT